MSLLTVGLSHRSAPMDLLERAALGADGARAMARGLVTTAGVSESLVLATCNRLEVYAEVSSFHAGVNELSSALAASAGVPLRDIADHLYFHHGEAALEHLFSVSAGLDSMALGESQVLGQVRLALRRGQDDQTVGTTLSLAVQRALRAGKRVHTETDIDRVGPTLVGVALDGGARSLGVDDLTGLHGLVVGAGSMSGLSATTLLRRGLVPVDVANRSTARGQRLAEQVGGRAVPLSDDAAMVDALAGADVVVTCTGASGFVLGEDLVTRARALRLEAGGGDQLLVDLALPRDVEPSVAELPGVHLVDLAALRARLSGADLDVDAARTVVAAELAEHLAAARAAQVGPTVAALRARAGEVVDAEMGRLVARTSRGGEPLDPRVRTELETTVHRVVEKLLHTPTVRVKALAAEGSGAEYAAALRELFDLPDAVGLTSGEESARAVTAVLDAPVATVPASPERETR